MSALISVVFSLISLLPEILSGLKFRNFWAPIASPPRQIGDGYHYFILLGKFDGLVRRKSETTEKVSIPLVAVTQLAGMAFNWIPYAVGSNFFGRKVGVVFVRFWSRFWLVLISVLLSAELANFLRVDSPFFPGILAFFFAFVLSPFGTRNGIWAQFLNRRHLYDQEAYNEMTRVFATETTTPILLGSLLAGLVVVDLGNPSIAGAVSAALAMVLTFVYPPALVAFLLFQVVILASSGMVGSAIFTACVGIASMAIVRSVLRSDPMSAPLIFGSLRVGVKGLSVSPEGLRISGRVLFFHLVSFALLFWSGEADETRFFGIFFATLIPASFSLFFGSYLGRIWQRGWEPIWSLFVASVSLAAIHSHLEASPLAFGSITLLFLAFFFLYFSRQAQFVVSAKAQYVDITSFSNFQSLEAESNKIVFPDDPSTALHISLFGEKISALENYSVQPFGYRRHLYNFVACLRSAGWTKQKTLNVLTSEALLTDWFMERPINPGDSLWEVAFNHTMQYWATNREYNLDLVKDGMYLPGKGWSESYSRLVARAWDSAADHNNYGTL